MFTEQISLSPDLKKLRDKGYEIQVVNGYLLVHSVPYVNSKQEIAYGTLVSKLDLANDKTVKPSDHVIRFIGEHPCNHDGTIITQIQHNTGNEMLIEGVTVNHSFSCKPSPDGYKDYYEKITTYERIISNEARTIDSSVTARTFKVIEPDNEDSVFQYIDSNSSRAEIGMISTKLKNLKIAIIGLGGTGSYVLDFVSKTEVKEIYLFDGDEFLQHNAFRAPGAATKEKLDQKLKKVLYLKEIYSKMHKGIINREYNIHAANLDELSGMDFVFICIDEGEIKRQIVEKLLADRIPFVDAGIGIEAIDGSLTGSARITTGTAEKNDHIDRRISFTNIGDDDYDQNIQIAELNALNAALAVIKWKKLFGFYHDLEKEHHSSYNINVNKLINDETNT